MAFYRNSYVPAFTSNDTYGNFYDASKVSLITVPERLKNYDSDVRKAGTPTTAAEYGDFLRRDGQYRAPDAYSRLHEQQVDLKQETQQPGGYDRSSVPHHLPPLQHQPQQQQQQQLLDSPPASPEPSMQQRQDSVRGPPPPASMDHYRGVAAPPPPPPPPPQPPAVHRPVLQQEQPPPSSPYQYRISRSRSPPPPPDVGAYRSNPDVYTGRGRAAVPPTPPPQQQQQQQQPLSSQPPPPQQRLEPQLPPVRLGQREVYLPSIESVEVHMRDNSRVLLDVHDFYRRYLRD